MVFKCINNLVPDYLYDKFATSSQRHNRNTRNVANNQLNIPKCRLATGQRSFYYRGCKLWNELKNNIRCVDNVSTFKRYIIKMLRSK